MATLPFPRLFEPGWIGKLKLPNRLVMPPIATDFASEGGGVSRRLISYYRERARGGVGMVVVEATCILAPEGQLSPRQLVMGEEQLSGLRELAQAIKDEGARAAIQLHHAGAAARAGIPGLQPVAPSAVARKGFPLPRELSDGEIGHIEDRFIQGAGLAREAGFEAVELHSAHHYLLAQFLTPLWNERRDEYGGAIGNRARLLTRIIQGIKKTLGDFPVICRFNAQEYGVREFYGVNGLSLEEAREVARLAERAGADALHVSCWGCGGQALANMPPTPGGMLPLAQAIKQVVSIPVIAVGRLEPKVGELALKEGRADFIAVGRALLADPYLPQKARQGKLEQITPCIACYDCLRIGAFGFEAKGLHCTVNPRLGREGEYGISRAEKPKRVVVVGGGSGGMEAARIAVLRGHRVTLFERENELGGSLRLAAKTGPHNRFGLLVSYLKKELARLSIEVKLGQEATPQAILQAKPDAVILACGGTPFVPPIPGLEKVRVATAADVLSGKATVGEKAIVIGGERMGCMTAEFLADLGKKVAILHQGSRLASKMNPPVRRPLMDRLEAKGVRMLTEVFIQGITELGAVIKDKEGKQGLVEGDSLVLAAGTLPNSELFRVLEGKVPQLYQVGDCLEPRETADAIAEGFHVGFTL